MDGLDDVSVLPFELDPLDTEFKESREEPFCWAADGEDRMKFILRAVLLDMNDRLMEEVASEEVGEGGVEESNLW